MIKVQKTGYVISENFHKSKYEQININKGMCPFDGLIQISSQNKPYSARGNSFLISIRNALIDNLYNEGVNINGENYTFHEESRDFLYDFDQFFLPDDIFDAIYLDNTPKEIEEDIFEYTNPNTKTIVVVNTNSRNEIMAVYPNGEKPNGTKSTPKAQKRFANLKPILIIKNTGYVIQSKGMGTACGFPEINFEDFVIQIDDKIFDPNQKDEDGRTNIERMKEGLAPKGIDGKPVNIHHVNQNPKGPLKEILASEHSKNTRELHHNRGPSMINRSQFGKFRRNYWKYRAKRTFGGKK